MLAVNGEATAASGNVISASTDTTKGKATAGKAFYFTAVPKVAASYSIKAVTYSMTPEGGTASTGLVPELVDKTSGLYKIPTVTGPIVLNFTVVGATSVTAPANSSVEVNFTTGNYSIGEDFAFTISGKTDNVTVGTVMYSR